MLNTQFWELLKATAIIQKFILQFQITSSSYRYRIDLILHFSVSNISLQIYRVRNEHTFF